MYLVPKTISTIQNTQNRRKSTNRVLEIRWQYICIWIWSIFYYFYSFFWSGLSICQSDYLYLPVETTQVNNKDQEKYNDRLREKAVYDQWNTNIWFDLCMNTNLYLLLSSYSIHGYMVTNTYGQSLLFYQGFWLLWILGNVFFCFINLFFIILQIGDMRVKFEYAGISGESTIGPATTVSTCAQTQYLSLAHFLVELT